MSVWLLEQKMTPEEEDAIESRTHLELPFEGLPDLSRVDSANACFRLLKMIDPDSPPESLVLRAERLWKLYGALDREDILVVPLSTGEVGLARKTGAYEYRDEKHWIPVEWFGFVSPRKAKKYATAFSTAIAPMREIEQKDARTFVQSYLPHEYNRFAGLQWIVGLLFALQMIESAINYIKTH